MNRYLGVFFIAHTFVLFASEDRATQNLKLDNMDLLQTLATFKSECKKKIRDVSKLFSLYETLKTCAELDMPFLPQAQQEQCVNIINKLSKSITRKRNVAPNSEEKKQEALFWDQAQEFSYRVNYYQSKLIKLKWLEEQINKSAWDLTWIKKLLDFKSSDVETDKEGIKQIRLRLLKQEKIETQDKLKKAKKTAPEKMPNFKTAQFSELLQIIDKITDKPKEKHSEKDVIALKCLGLYVRVLSQADFDWFSKEVRLAARKAVNSFEYELWGNKIFSRNYYRWKLKAIDWAEENIKKDAVENNLSWIFHVINMDYDIQTPNAQILKRRRLAALKARKKQTEELFNNCSNRPILKKK